MFASAPQARFLHWIFLGKIIHWNSAEQNHEPSSNHRTLPLGGGISQQSPDEMISTSSSWRPLRSQTHPSSPWPGLPLAGQNQLWRWWWYALLAAPYPLPTFLFHLLWATTFEHKEQPLPEQNKQDQNRIWLQVIPQTTSDIARAPLGFIKRGTTNPPPPSHFFFIFLPQSSSNPFFSACPSLVFFSHFKIFSN